MGLLSQKFLPGIVLLVAGLAFIVHWKRIMQGVLDSNEKFWKETLKFQAEVGKYGELFLKIIILFLGVVFFLSGVLLIYQYIKRGG